MFSSSIFFFFNDTATTEIYTLSLHDALPIYIEITVVHLLPALNACFHLGVGIGVGRILRRVVVNRSEEHTSELQSHSDLVCRLLLEKKNVTSQSLSMHSYRHRRSDQRCERSR